MTKPDRAQQAFENLTQMVIDSIETAIANGSASWTKPWIQAIGTHGLPHNVNGHVYSGGNTWICLGTAMMKGFTSPVWATYNQWTDYLGIEEVKWVESRLEEVEGKRKKMPHTTYLLRPQPIVIKKDKDGNNLPESEWKKVVKFKAYPVYNADQVVGATDKIIAEAANPNKPEPVDHAELFFASIGAEVGHDDPTGAYLNPLNGWINIPPIELFSNAQEYYGVLGHEHIHLTGMKGLLAREGVASWATDGRPAPDVYAFEELVAELGSVFLNAGVLRLEVTPRDDHAEYLRHWLSQLREDPKALWKAASQATKAVNFLTEAAERGSLTAAVPVAA